MKRQFNEEDPFEKLRLNARNEKQFTRACHEKLDGLRILQYLKSRQNEEPSKDESNLVEYISHYYPSESESLFPGQEEVSFDHSSLEDLEKIRVFLMQKEEEYQVSSSLL